MFDQFDLGSKLKRFRQTKNLTQSEVAKIIGVSAQSVSKWEKGECLPDIYNLKLLGQLYRVSLDSLLESDLPSSEKIIKTITIHNATFEIIRKPETILAGRILYAKNYKNIGDFHAAISEFNDDTAKKQQCWGSVKDCISPIFDIHLSVNFWLGEVSRAFGFVRETTTLEQPQGLDIFQIPASLFIRAYTDTNTAQLISKQQCDIWELFAYIRNHFMPAHGFKMAENGAQELEVFDTPEHKTGYAYMPVIEVSKK